MLGLGGACDKGVGLGSKLLVYLGCGGVGRILLEVDVA